MLSDIGHRISENLITLPTKMNFATRCTLSPLVHLHCGLPDEGNLEYPRQNGGRLPPASVRLLALVARVPHFDGSSSAC